MSDPLSEAFVHEASVVDDDDVVMRSLIDLIVRTGLGGKLLKALLQRLAAVRGRLSLCADQAAAAKW
ncbi:hypothetical protein, partial [Microbacterium schleiferi]|uniref:hypothetical protein n=1 Tax=Microbacterium schleiferi TaxID=69362 RepID=UPI001D176691